MALAAEETAALDRRRLDRRRAGDALSLHRREAGPLRGYLRPARRDHSVDRAGLRRSGQRADGEELALGTGQGRTRAYGHAMLGVHEARGRQVLAATIFGSGMASLDATVVNIALPAISRDLGGGLGAMQWIVNGYTLVLAT